MTEQLSFNLNPDDNEPQTEKSKTEELKTEKPETENWKLKTENHYLERLRQKLQDPEFRQIEGFPIGEDEDILALSDPPYYTACPNPFLEEIIAKWQQERSEFRVQGSGFRVQSSEAETAPSESKTKNQKLGTGNWELGTENYHREPFAADVSEGKNDPIYNAHSYHTKVPHKAIMRYILHYTDPGDIVFDGFCGTGMTGVAAQLCGDRAAVESLGYRVDEAGVVYDGGQAISRLGARKAVLNDLSPAATFIAYNYNTPVDVKAFEKEAKRILREVEKECGWMYETWHPHCDHPQRVKAKVNYTVWSEVLLCPECSRELVFFDEAYNLESKTVKREFSCPQCGVNLSKVRADKYKTTYHDDVTGQTVETLKRVPVAIEYKIGRTKHMKRLDEWDLHLVERITAMTTPVNFVRDEIPFMHMTHQRAIMANYGVTHLHHFFLPRARHALNALWQKVSQIEDSRIRAFLRFLVEQAIWGMSKQNRFSPKHFSQVNRYMTGVYYIPSLISEVSPGYILIGKTKRLCTAFSRLKLLSQIVAISTKSTTAKPRTTEFADYIFTDPPFGENIYYADLNFLIESWHGVITNSTPEVIVDKAKHKVLHDYTGLMRESFQGYYECLKPGRWMTVEFHNSHNSVWNSIQEALLSAGFVIADVRTLDKKQRSYRQITASSAAKQDLVISAYKPHNDFERRFLKEAGTPEGAWDFIRQHLVQLPCVVEKDGLLETIAERQDYLLFDRMVAFHIQRGASVPLSAAEFYAGLRERFVERDGMVFLPEQVLEYDRARLKAQAVAQLALFLSDEKSAIQWLRQQLDPAMGGAPQTYQALQPQFLRQLHQARHEALPELSEILEQNFLQDEAGHWYVPDPNKAGDLEKLRQRALLREFNQYLAGRGRLRQFRTEAVRAGFADAWSRRDYATIVNIAERLPERVLQEDPDLLMYYDNASLRVD